MFVLKNEGIRRKKNWYMVCRGQARPCHYRHGPCQASGVWGFGKARDGTGRATAGTGRAKVLAVLTQNFFSPFS